MRGLRPPFSILVGGRTYGSGLLPGVLRFRWHRRCHGLLGVVMRNYLASAGLLLLAVLASPAHAVDYYWSTTANHDNRYPDPQSACDWLASITSIPQQGYTKTGNTRLGDTNEYEA